jgi:hypothetical protein
VVTDRGEVVIDQEILGEVEMDDDGDEEGIKRGHEDEEDEDEEAKRRKLD